MELILSNDDACRLRDLLSDHLRDLRLRSRAHGGEGLSTPDAAPSGVGGAPARATGRKRASAYAATARAQIDVKPSSTSSGMHPDNGIPASGDENSVTQSILRSISKWSCVCVSVERALRDRSAETRFAGADDIPTCGSSPSASRRLTSKTRRRR